eukprot:gene7193-9811_t
MSVQSRSSTVGSRSSIRTTAVGGGVGNTGSQSSAVRVICRIRPQNAREIREGGVPCLKHTETTIEVTQDDGEQKFNFDRIFGSDSTQEEVFFYTASPIVSDVLSGYNATIFAYGQTGTGKTHTMEGDIHSPTGKGIIPRTVDALFDGVSQADENIEFTIRISYVEIYLEKINDLLDEHHVKTNLTIREDKIKGIYIAGVTEEYVTSQDELLGIMATGATNRATAATGMNEGSSRSHSVFTITVTQKDTITNATKSAKLVLVDLAGSEMVRKTNASGQQLEEAKMINKSLSALGQVINALTDEKQSHIPYRDSKLTRVLQDSLGGNSKTVLIMAISPSSFNAMETVSTLRFGTRAKKIENKVTVNQTRSIEELEALLVKADKAIDAQTAHIIALSTQLAALQASSAGQDDTDNESETGPKKSGKKVMDTATIEAETAAMKKLHETVAVLTLELDEERQESNRKDLELRKITSLLKDKERLIQDAANMLSEVQRSNESLRERSEQLLREKIEAVGQLESMKSQQDEDVNKNRFNMMEMEVTLQTLRQENEQLKTEIAEMSGDATTSPRDRKGGKSKNIISSAMDDDNVSVVSRSMMSLSGLASKTRDAGDDSSKALTSEERKEIMNKYSALFDAACMKHKLTEPASSELFSILASFSSEQEKTIAAVEDKAHTIEKTSGKRIRDLEEQRVRVEKDLQSRIENMIQLQIKYDSLSRMDGRQFNEAMQEKDRSHLKSLQQRLEQLVAVHRQLLRKFASLELENSELKKKTVLRDERIKQLEGNAKGLIGNIRQQAERHVSELTNLREQIQNLKAEHELRLENFKQDGANQSQARTVNARGVVQHQKTVRGGGGHNIKSIYGDMAAVSSPKIAATPVASPITISGGGGNIPAGAPGNRNSSSVLSRFLGGSQNKP